MSKPGDYDNLGICPTMEHIITNSINRLQLPLMGGNNKLWIERLLNDLFLSCVTDALLADLQNSVPGHQPQQYGTTTQTVVTSVQQQRQAPQPQHNYIESSSGYGSLRGKAPPTQVCL